MRLVAVELAPLKGLLFVLNVQALANVKEKTATISASFYNRAVEGIGHPLVITNLVPVIQPARTTYSFSKGPTSIFSQVLHQKTVKLQIVTFFTPGLLENPIGVFHSYQDRVSVTKMVCLHHRPMM